MICGSGLTRGTVSLTHRSIEALRPAQAPYRVSDQRCIGLAVRVAASGVKTWDLAYRVRGMGRVRRISLGRVGDVSLEKARERANQLTSAARTGRDLLAEEEESRVAAASRLTIGDLIELYVRRRVTGRLRTAKEIENRLNRALSPIRHRYADEMRRRDIRELLDAAADQKIKREAEKRRQTIGAMFRWALSQDIVELDPTAGLAAYDPGRPRDRVLTVEEIESLWKWLCSDALPSDPADILKIELLTGARCGEISGLCVKRYRRVDMDAPRCALKEQETARHAGRGSGPKDYPGKAFHHSVRATVPDRARHPHGIAPPRMLFAKSSTQAANRKIHHTRSTADGSNDAGRTGRRAGPYCGGHWPRAGWDRDQNAGSTLRPHRPD